MRKLLSRRPSPAMVVALIALLFAMGGSVYAASKINGKKIKKDSIPGNRIKSGTISGEQVVPQGLKAGNVLAAEIPNGCTSAGGNTGGISASAAGTECNVTFPRDVSNCAIVLGTRFDFPGGGETTYRKPSSNVVQVSRRDSAGGTPTAGAFSIAAICPEV